MAANTSPIYSLAPDIQIKGPINTVAAVLYNGAGTIGTDVYALWIPDATNGGYIQRLRLKYIANATTTSIAAVLKLYIASVSSGATTDANCALFDEIALPATGVLTTTAVNAGYDIPLGFALDPGYSLCAKITVAQSANTGWMSTAIGGMY